MAKTEGTTAQKINQIYLDYRQHPQRVDWEEQIIADKNFYFNNQWTQEQKEILESRGQADVVMNVVRSLIKHLVAMITNRNPIYKALPRKLGTVRMASILNDMLLHIWTNSHGNKQNERNVFKMINEGLGYLFVHYDPFINEGEGDLQLKELNPLDVYVDPYSEDFLFRDAKYIIISKRIPLEKAQELYPNYKNKLAQVIDNTKYDENVNRGMERAELFLGQADNGANNPQFVRVHEAYDRFITDVWQIRDKMFDNRFIAEFYKAPKNNEEAAAMNELLSTPFIEGVDDQTGEVIIGSRFDVSFTRTWRVRKTVCVADQITISRSVMQRVSEYPIVPSVYEETGNPFPVGETRFIKGIQEYINKWMSVTMLDAQVNANPRSYYEKGALDPIQKATIEDDSARPGAMIEVQDGAISGGKIREVAAGQLSTAWFGITEFLISFIEKTTGFFALRQGDPSQAPRTATATLQLTEFAGEKTVPLRRTIAIVLGQLGTVTFQMARSFYSFDRIMHIIKEDGSIEPQTLNQVEIVDGIHRVLNDINVGEYDITVSDTSFRPTNRMAELEQNLRVAELAGGQLLPIMMPEILKNLDISNIKEIMAKYDEMLSLQAENQRMEEQLENVSRENQGKNKVIDNLNRQKDRELEHHKMSENRTKIEEGAKTEINKIITDLMAFAEVAKDKDNNKQKEKVA
jgi:hypothetical protein